MKKVVNMPRCDQNLAQSSVVKECMRETNEGNFDRQSDDAWHSAMHAQNRRQNPMRNEHLATKADLEKLRKAIKSDGKSKASGIWMLVASCTAIAVAIIEMISRV